MKTKKGNKVKVNLILEFDLDEYIDVNDEDQRKWFFNEFLGGLKIFDSIGGQVLDINLEKKISYELILKNK